MRGVDRSFEVIWQTAKQGAIDPISMLNDYLNTVFDDVVTCSLCRCCRNTARLPRYPREKPQLAAILSLHVERLSFKKLIILFCRLPHEIETHLLGYLEGLWWSCFIIIFKVSGLCSWVCPLQQKHHPNYIGLCIIFQKRKGCECKLQCTLPEQNSKIAVMENSTASVMLATTKATFSFLSFTIAGITDKYLNFSVFL